jgi:hypothetical protein
MDDEPDQVSNFTLWLTFKTNLLGVKVQGKETALVADNHWDAIIYMKGDCTKQIRQNSKKIQNYFVNNFTQRCVFIHSTHPLHPPSQTTTFKALPDNLGRWFFGMQPYFDPTRKMTCNKKGNSLKKFLKNWRRPKKI